MVVASTVGEQGGKHVLAPGCSHPAHVILASKTIVRSASVPLADPDADKESRKIRASAPQRLAVEPSSGTVLDTVMMMRSAA